MQKLSKEAALRIIVSKGIVSGPGVHRCKVTNVTPFPSMRANGVRQVAIANFNAKTAYQEEAAATLFGQGDYDKAANQGLSLSILEGQFCPQPGQIVDVVVEEVTTKNNVTGLFAQSCTLAPVEQPVRRTMEDFLRMAEGVEVNDEPSALVEQESPFQQVTSDLIN